MKSCEIFDNDNEMINYLALKQNTSKKWVIHKLLFYYAENENNPHLKIKGNKIQIKES